MSIDIDDLIKELPNETQKVINCIEKINSLYVLSDLMETYINNYRHLINGGLYYTSRKMVRRNSVISKLKILLRNGTVILKISCYGDVDQLGQAEEEKLIEALKISTEEIINLLKDKIHEAEKAEYKWEKVKNFSYAYIFTMSAIIIAKIICDFVSNR